VVGNRIAGDVPGLRFSRAASVAAGLQTGHSMRHLARHLALAAFVFATGSNAAAAPAHHGKKSHHVEPAEDQPADSDRDGDEAVSHRDGARVAHEAWHHAKDRRDRRDDERDSADEDVKPARHAKSARRHGTAAEDFFAEDDERPSATKHHVELDAEDDADRDPARPALKAKRHSVEADDEELPNRKKVAKHHSAVETLPSDDEVEVAPRRKSTRRARTSAGAHRKPAKRDTDDDSHPGAEEDAAATVAASSPRLTAAKDEAPDAAKAERVAFADPDQPARAVDADTIRLDSPARLHRHAEPSSSKDWRVAFGPYLWASSVDANVSLGPTTVSSGVDFVQLEQHARYGMEFLSEAHYKQLGVYGDLMYGVVAVDGSRNVGPLMVSLNGEASSILIDGAAGYTFYGDDHSVLSLEARGGVRYQRTGVSAQLGLSGATVTPPEQISAGADALAGGHVVVRPRDWFFLTGTADIGVVGASSRTWSASADANVQLGPRLLVTVGYRTLTMDRTQVELVLHGPRAAVQLTF